MVDCKLKHDGLLAALPGSNVDARLPRPDAAARDQLKLLGNVGQDAEHNAFHHAPRACRAAPVLGSGQFAMLSACLEALLRQSLVLLLAFQYACVQGGDIPSRCGVGCQHFRASSGLRSFKRTSIAVQSPKQQACWIAAVQRSTRA